MYFVGKKMFYTDKWRYGVIISLISVFMIARVAFIFFSPSGVDETYYWLWGQKLQLSYYDHPPLHSYVQRLFHELFGTNNFALRVATLISFTSIYFSFLYICKKACPDSFRKNAIYGLLIIVGVHQLNLMTMLATMDHLLLALVSVAMVMTVCIFHDIKSKNTFDVYKIYIVAILIGLAHLTKYNAILFLAPLIICVFIDKSLRVVLFSYHTYLAGLLMIGIISPIIIWNYNNGLVSFEYNFSIRIDKDFSIEKHISNILVFIIVFAVNFSPILLLHIYNIYRREKAESNLYIDILKNFSLVSLVVCFIFACILAASHHVHIHWVDVSCVAPVFLAGLVLPSFFRTVSHGLFGVLLILAHILFGLFPGRAIFPETSIMYGWKQIVRETRALSDAYPGSFLLSTDYRIGSVWAFHLDNSEVDVLVHRESQFTLWLDVQKNLGRDAVILSSDLYPITPAVTDSFASIEQVGSVIPSFLGQEVVKYKYKLHVGRDFRPDTCDTHLVPLRRSEQKNDAPRVYRYGCTWHLGQP